MPRFLADENFNGRILRGVLRRLPTLDVLRAQDTPLYGAADQDLLAWAADEGRILLTHDVATLVGYAYERLSSGLPMSGVVAVRTDCPIGRIVEDLELIVEAGEADTLDRRILFLPL